MSGTNPKVADATRTMEFDIASADLRFFQLSHCPSWSSLTTSPCRQVPGRMGTGDREVDALTTPLLMESPQVFSRQSSFLSFKAALQSRRTQEWIQDFSKSARIAHHLALSHRRKATLVGILSDRGHREARLLPTSQGTSESYLRFLNMPLYARSID